MPVSPGRAARPPPGHRPPAIDAPIAAPNDAPGGRVPAVDDGRARRWSPRRRRPGRPVLRRERGGSAGRPARRSSAGRIGGTLGARAAMARPGQAETPSPVTTGNAG